MASTVDSERVHEFNEEGTPEYEKKLDKLTEMIKASKYTVFYTGAGISTSAGIGDYRGPSGAWTKRRIDELEGKGKTRSPDEEDELQKLLIEVSKEEKKSSKKVSMLDALPTPGHMAQATLIRLGIAHYVVTTNLDGIYRKSGLIPHTQLCCLHGDVYVERCTACSYEFERNYHVRRDYNHVHDHHVGDCEKCGSKTPQHYKGSPGDLEMNNSKWGGRMIGTCDQNCGTKDTFINFGENLDDIDWNEADKHCRKAELCIIAGTSMSLRHITHFPFYAKKVIIINLQNTPDDDKVQLRIYAKTDPVFIGIMNRLNVPIDPIPIWRPRDALPIDRIPKQVHKFFIEKAVELENFYNRLEEERKTEKVKKPTTATTTAMTTATTTATTMTTTTTTTKSVKFPKQLMIGNSHVPEPSGDKVLHKWTVYVKLPKSKKKQKKNNTSNNNNDNDNDNNNNDNNDNQLDAVIDHVEFQLHTTFVPPIVQVDKAPYEVTRRGWGTFEIKIKIFWNSKLTSRGPSEFLHELSFDAPDTFKIVDV